MTLNRLIFPLSEHAMPDWIERTALGDILETDFSTLHDETVTTLVSAWTSVPLELLAGLQPLGQGPASRPCLSMFCPVNDQVPLDICRAELQRDLVARLVLADAVGEVLPVAQRLRRSSVRMRSPAFSPAFWAGEPGRTLPP